MITPETRAPAEPPGIFGSWGLLALLGVTLVAARLASPWVALLGASLLLVGVVARLWASWSLDALIYTRSGASLPETPDGRAPILTTRPPGSPAAPVPASPGAPIRAFCGDTVLLETRLANRKPLPLPWVEVWERLPLALDPGGDLVESIEARGQHWMCQGASLWPYQRARWQHRLVCRRRGVYAIRSARVRAGDPFGLGEREALLPGRLNVVVYPRVVPLRQLALPLLQALLDAAARRSLIADPTRTAWVRDYQPGDPHRLIHWPATAHRGALQVRVPEPATSLQVALLLDLVSFDVVLRVYRDTLFELAVSALASIAAYLCQSGQPVGLWTTTRAAAHVAPSASPAQLQILLEHLARVEPHRTPTAERQGLGGLPRGAAVVLAASDLALDLAATVARLEAAGQRVVTVLASSGGRTVALPPERVVRVTPDVNLAAALEGVGRPVAAATPLGQ